MAVDAGALLGGVTLDGPADEAGLRGADDSGRGGDVIVSIDGRRVRSSEDVADAVAASKPGSTVEVEYLRGEERETVEVELGERPDSLTDAEPQPEGDGDGLLPLP